METTIISISLDIVLIGSLLVLGCGSLTTADMRRAVMLFIGFGLLLALIWVRLRAPDIALAEAAIGAGLTGALLLAALRDQAEVASAKSTSGTVGSILLTALSGGLAIVLGFTYIHAIDRSDAIRLADDVHANLEISGVSNPVTAVLLNFRAYDTLLELAVLLAAVLGILALGGARMTHAPSGPVLSSLTRWLVPLIILVSAYLLWAGAHAPGGAFQAGALLAAAGVLLRLAGHPAAGLPKATALRGLTVAGVAVFITVGLATMLTSGAFLDYPTAWAGGLILIIETAAMLSIAITLVIAYLCGEPEQWISTTQPSEEQKTTTADKQH